MKNIPMGGIVSVIAVALLAIAFGTMLNWVQDFAISATSPDTKTAQAP